MPKMPALKLKDGIESYHEASDFLAGFNKYVNDNMPFRNVLFRLYRDIKMHIFNVSPVPDRVVIGEKGWFFIGDINSDAIKESKGIKVFGPDELKQCADNIAYYNSYLFKKGIKFYFAVAPGKATVYGQFLPIEKSPRPTKLEQITEELAKRNIRVIDLKEDFVLLPHVRLYHKTDSHWNQAGAYLGYYTLIKWIKLDFPQVSPLSLNNFRIDTAESGQKDFCKTLQTNLIEYDIRLCPLEMPQAVEGKQQLPMPKDHFGEPSTYERRFTCTGKPLKVLVFGDSFLASLVRYIAESFGETIFVYSKVNKDVIAIEQPDIVISETVERELDYFVNLY